MARYLTFELNFHSCTWGSLHENTQDSLEWHLFYRISSKPVDLTMTTTNTSPPKWQSIFLVTEKINNDNNNIINNISNTCNISEFIKCSLQLHLISVLFSLYISQTFFSVWKLLGRKEKDKWSPLLFSLYILLLSA